MTTREPLDWDDLRYFLEALRAGTLAGAARALGVEHTTIGRRLSALERALGAPLMLRGPDGLRPTALGDALAPLAAEIEQRVLSIRKLTEMREARVRLSVPSGFVPLFTDQLARLRIEQPALTLEIVSGASLADLDRGDADLAVRSTTSGNKELIARKLVPVGFSLYAAESYLSRRGRPTSPEALAGHEVIGFDASLDGAPPARWLAEHARDAHVVLRGREMADLLAAARGGLGVALLPCLIADEQPGLVRLTPELLATRPLSLVYRREARLSPHVRAVARFVLDVVAQHAARIAGTPRAT